MPLLRKPGYGPKKTVCVNVLIHCSLCVADLIRCGPRLTELLGKVAYDWFCMLQSDCGLLSTCRDEMEPSLSDDEKESATNTKRRLAARLRAS